MTRNQSFMPITFIYTVIKTSLCACLPVVLFTFSVYCVAQTPEPTPPNPVSSNPVSTSTEPTSTATTTPNPDAASTNGTSTLSARNSLRANELLADILVDESHWLDTSEGKILALYRRTEARETKGALLLLHAAEDPQVWPPALENLRRNLPKYGWETLAISLPQQHPVKVPARETQPASTNAEPDQQTEPATPPAAVEAPSVSTPAREQLIKAYLLAALNFLNEKGQFNLVVLVDNSSFYWCMQLLSPSIKTNQVDPNTVDGPLQALIITNLQPQEPLSTQELEASFNQPQLPVLDIFFAPDDLEQKHQRELHKTVAMRNKLDYYQPLLLEPYPKIIETHTTSFLLGRVRGFMEKKAKGTEIDVKEKKKE